MPPLAALPRAIPAIPEPVYSILMSSACGDGPGEIRPSRGNFSSPSPQWRRGEESASR
jgi:hypothetical protein